MASRVLVSLGEERTAKLDSLAARDGRPRSALIREAVDRYLAAESPQEERERRLTALKAGFGLWAEHGIATDPHEYERRRRAEWTRPWDDDYEEVRAESPDLFDEEDDRQRRIYLDMVAGRYPEPKYPQP